MAAVGLFWKCQKTVNPGLQSFYGTKKKGTVLFDCIVKFSSSSKYDLVVIGGGSGGLSCAKEAGSLGASVCVIDYVTPSPKGNTWGLGGTCVNVGCIPKKLMHEAALLGEAIHDADAYGWNIKDLNDIHVDWAKLIKAIQDHIKSINWVTRVALRESNIKYYNGIARFIDKNLIEVKLKNSEIMKIYGDNIVIAVGGRPKYPNIPGATEYGISSDDLFNLDKSPGKTLIVGAGYVALECAGFLSTFKCPVTLMVRSVVLRNFDQQMASLIEENMKERGISFVHKTVPIKIEKNGQNLTVTYKNTDTKKIQTDNFDSIMFAIGRRASTKELITSGVNIKIDPCTGKIYTEDERTSVSHIYAVGDVIHGKPELSPVAIEAGKLLARRIFSKSKETMNYKNIATTIFTPLEYSCVGLSEEKAITSFGEDNIEVYHAFYKPTEFLIPQKSISQCYLKVISLRKEPNTILGMHFIGPTAGEVMQGYAAAMQSNFTMNHLKATVGIHPTVAEEFTRLNITKRSGLNPTPPSCCN